MTSKWKIIGLLAAVSIAGGALAGCEKSGFMEKAEKRAQERAAENKDAHDKRKQ